MIMYRNLKFLINNVMAASIRKYYFVASYQLPQANIVHA